MDNSRIGDEEYADEETRSIQVQSVVDTDGGML